MALVLALVYSHHVSNYLAVVMMSVGDLDADP